jgi:transcription initiation factor TFIID subunit 5
VVSQDVTLAAAGFSDSIVRVHSLKDPLPNPKVSFETGSKKAENDDSDMPDKSVYTKKFIGHSGAVFGLSFSPDQRFLLSCSEDQTVRLWSMETMTNLVCYRGHSYPVWDVDFGPEGICIFL